MLSSHNLCDTIHWKPLIATGLLSLRKTEGNTDGWGKVLHVRGSVLFLSQTIQVLDKIGLPCEHHGENS